MAVYIGLLRKETDSIFGVDFPDFPGCITASETLGEARQKAAEALEFHIEGMLEDGADIPQPTSLESVMSDPSNADAIPFHVNVNCPEIRNIEIVMTQADLDQIDKLIGPMKMSRSQFVAQAARKALELGDA